MSLRLNKLLAQRGIGARRKCDALIQQGRVRVNGKVVLEPGTMVEPERDRVEVSGQPLPRPIAPLYYALHKPVGVISTLQDPEGRKTIRDLMPPGPRLFPVGRLDADTSGLLLITNDGELAHHLMHPRYGVEKVYRVRLDRAASEGHLARLRHGVEFEPGVVSGPARVRSLPSEGSGGRIEIAIHEGRYRQVRRMCEAVGLTVLGLHRSAYGPLRLGPIERGMWRELSAVEVARLRAVSARPRPRRGRRPAEFFSARRGWLPPSGEGRPARPGDRRSDRTAPRATRRRIAEPRAAEPRDRRRRAAARPERRFDPSAPRSGRRSDRATPRPERGFGSAPRRERRFVSSAPRSGRGSDRSTPRPERRFGSSPRPERRFDRSRRGPKRPSDRSPSVGDSPRGRVTRRRPEGPRGRSPRGRRR